MSNPFDPLITTSDFKTVIGFTGPDSEIEAFLTSAYKIFLKFGLPIRMNGTETNRTEETEIVFEGGYTSDNWEIDPIPKTLVLLLKYPIKSLTSVQLKNQIDNPPTFSPDLPLIGFQFRENQTWIETYYWTFSAYAPIFWPLANNYARYAQVNYTTGLSSSSRSTLLDALIYIYFNQGLEIIDDPKINEMRAISERADDRTTVYTEHGLETIGNYINNNPALYDLLSELRGVKRPII